VLSSIQVLSENSTIVVIDREEIHVETILDNGVYPAPQDYNGLEYPVYETI
jgi:hypothetical protein